MANITQRGEIQICLCNIQGVMCVLEQLICDFTSDTDSRYGTCGVFSYLKRSLKAGSYSLLPVAT